jgi:hypothetical protein
MRSITVTIVGLALGGACFAITRQGFSVVRPQRAFSPAARASSGGAPWGDRMPGRPWAGRPPAPAAAPVPTGSESAELVDLAGLSELDILCVEQGLASPCHTLRAHLEVAIRGWGKDAVAACPNAAGSHPSRFTVRLRLDSTPAQAHIADVKLEVPGGSAAASDVVSCLTERIEGRRGAILQAGQTRFPEFSGEAALDTQIGDGTCTGRPSGAARGNP